MSRRKASSAGTVSLFPFLAVLVCAMGALILLLLVTTRRIRQQSIAEDDLQQFEAPELPAVPDSPQPSPSVAVVTPPDPADQPLLPLFAADPPPQRHDPTPALLDELAVLESRQVKLASEVAQQQQNLARLEALASTQSEALEESQSVASEHAAEKRRLNNLYTRLREQQVQTKQRAEDMRRQIRQARAQAAEADSRFAVVPYDGDSGTIRRPIIIECTANRLTFASEGISLTADDLNGFPPRYNPLLSVTQALVRYWERQQRSDADIGNPYVMLVVRPGGTIGYYVARGLLAPMGNSFGYELVTDDQQFAWPEGDPAAAAICRTIIDKMLTERDAMIDVAVQRGATLGQYSNERGQFELAEIEQLKNPTREVTINGQRFSREPQTYDRFSRRSGGTAGTGGVPDRSRSGYGSAEDTMPHSSAARGGARMRRGDRNADDANPRGVYTQQNSAITQEDRMPEWLRDGTTRVESPPSSRPSSRMTDIDPFAAPDESSTRSLPPMSVDRAPSSGQSSAFDAAAMEAGAPDPSRQAPQRLDFARRGLDEATRLDDGQPQWGPRSGSGLIGFEKQVDISVSTTQITIGDHSAFQVDRSTSIADLRRLLAGGINREVRNWGSAPKSFYWVPAIRFSVTPDARQQYERLKKIIGDWELQASVEFTTD